MEDVPDPQVAERARRRTCTAKDKRDVLAGYEAVEPAVKDRARLCREVQRLTGELDQARQVTEVQSQLSACWTASRPTAAGTTASDDR